MLGRARAAVLGGLERAGRRQPELAALVRALHRSSLFVLCFVATFPHELLAAARAPRGDGRQSPFAVETGAEPARLDARVTRSSRCGCACATAKPSRCCSPRRCASRRRASGCCVGNPYPLGIGAALYGGTLRGVVDPRPASFRVDATLEGVDLARYTGLASVARRQLRGRLEGTVALDGAGRGPAAATGTVALRIPGLTLEGAKVRGITVPDLHFGDVHLTGTVKNGRLEIGEIVADGQEIDLRGEGNVLLRDPLDEQRPEPRPRRHPAAGAPDG